MTTEHFEYFRSHNEAIALATLIRSRGLTAEVVDGERNGYVVRWWTKKAD